MGGSGAGTLQFSGGGYVETNPHAFTISIKVTENPSSASNGAHYPSQFEQNVIMANNTIYYQVVVSGMPGSQESGWHVITPTNSPQEFQQLSVFSSLQQIADSLRGSIVSLGYATVNGQMVREYKIVSSNQANANIVVYAYINSSDEITQVTIAVNAGNAFSETITERFNYNVASPVTIAPPPSSDILLPNANAAIP